MSAPNREEIVIDNDQSSNSIETNYPLYFVRRKSSVHHHHRRCNFVRRLVRKSGKSSIYQKTIPQRLYRYLVDLSNTLINCHWKWTLLTLSLAFILTWLAFACLWMIISMDNDDLDVKNGTAAERRPCLSGIQSFAGYLLFSIETQSTIGYGNRYINHYCPEAIVLLCVQITVGVCICGSLVSIAYAKMIGSSRLHSMNCFSKYAVVNERDGHLCLIFRVRDYSGRYECFPKITAYLVQKRQHSPFLKSIKLDPPGILIWPVEVVHRINETSPFWDLSAKDLIVRRFEIVTVLEGISTTTSRISRTRTSYLSTEILWGHKFKPCVKYNKNKCCYIINQKHFNKTEEILTPLCSAKRLNEVFSDMSSSMSPQSLSISTTNTPSPIFNDLKLLRRYISNGFDNNNFEKDDSGGDSTIVDVTVHQSANGNPISDNTKEIRKVQKEKWKNENETWSDGDSSYSSLNEESDSSTEEEQEGLCDGACLMDVDCKHKLECKCLKDVKHLYRSLEKFVEEDNKQKNGGATMKTFIETNF